jgi:ABC-type uncharacterized transport system fused permease/ATPase subunit
MSEASHVMPSDRIKMVDVTVYTPLEKLLVSKLSFECLPSDRLLITGPSGSGKSSLLRVICGLWAATSGEVFCLDTQTFFMPQKPFLTAGPLRSQFSYPSTADLSDAELLRLLEKVNLVYLLSRFNPDSVEDWTQVLSGGEQQRIGMARLLYNRPVLAVLDECTSAVDSPMEALFYSQLVELGALR